MSRAALLDALRVAHFGRDFHVCQSERDQLERMADHPIIRAAMAAGHSPAGAVWLYQAHPFDVLDAADPAERDALAARYVETFGAWMLAGVQP